MLSIDADSDPKNQALVGRASSWAERLVNAVAAAVRLAMPNHPGDADFAEAHAILDEIHAQATPLELFLVLKLIHSGKRPSSVVALIVHRVGRRFVQIELPHLEGRRNAAASN